MSKPLLYCIAGLLFAPELLTADDKQPKDKPETKPATTAAQPPKKPADKPAKPDAAQPTKTDEPKAADDVVPHRQILSDQIKAMNDLTAALKPVKDVASAEKAKADIEKIAATFKSIRERSDKQKAPSAKVTAALQKEFKSSLNKARKDLLVEIYRLQKAGDGEAGKVVLGALKAAK